MVDTAARIWTFIVLKDELWRGDNYTIQSYKSMKSNPGLPQNLKFNSNPVTELEN